MYVRSMYSGGVFVLSAGAISGAMSVDTHARRTTRDDVDVVKPYYLGLARFRF